MYFLFNILISPLFPFLKGYDDHMTYEIVTRLEEAEYMEWKRSPDSMEVGSCTNALMGSCIYGLIRRWRRGLLLSVTSLGNSDDSGIRGGSIFYIFQSLSVSMYYRSNQ